MTNQPGVSQPKVKVMLAGAGHEAVYYQMQPPFIADARFTVAAIATQWSDFEKNLVEMKPELTIVQVDIAPGADALLGSLARLQVWNGVAILVLPQNLRNLKASLEDTPSIRGVFILPVNWGEVLQAGFAAVLTDRARSVASGSLQQAYLSRTTSAITGTRIVAFVSACGGVGRSTLAENVGYELATRMNIHTLLMSLDLPPTAVPHLGLRYLPNSGEFFIRPGDGFGSSIQSREGLDVIVAPENSIEYARHAADSNNDQSSPNSIYSLVMAGWTRNYAAVLLDLPAGEQAWSLQPIAAANTAVIVARPTLADMAATRHSLILLLERLSGQLRIPREAMYLVLNQVSDQSPISARGFYDELVQAYGWAPPVVAVIPFDPGVSQAQDRQTPPVIGVDGFAKGIRSLVNALFPVMGAETTQERKKSTLRLGGLKVRLG